MTALDAGPRTEDAGAPPPVRPRRSRTAWLGSDRFLAVATPVLVLVLWEALAQVGIIDTRFFPAPSAIVVRGVEMLASGELVEHTWVSVRRLLIAILIGGVPALLLGLAMGLSRKLRAALDPIIAATYPVPKSAIFPLFLLVFGLGEASKIAVVAVGVFYPIAVNTVAGVREIAPIYHDVGTNFGARRWQVFRTIAFPGALPLILTGFNLAFGMALMLLVVAEMLGAKSGLGFLIWNSWQTFQVENMYVGLVVISLLGFLFALLVKGLEGVLVPWRKR
ncbi:ABC transporter permease [Pseudonocardia oroxyli]|uniref:NitT/TauT family transport system permease protein n=1 Tax=Pseudonocardia oroxyli TaxID=366584 RepID=A0A1G8CZS8_PSEOR|nr:ABC transporter permease [Pseudonocardia oroxyli]SDH50723.1 NitT/TauT family transport system permease protein [Pseudonocardia oroxyli]